MIDENISEKNAENLINKESTLNNENRIVIALERIADALEIIANKSKN